MESTKHKKISGLSKLLSCRMMLTVTLYCEKINFSSKVNVGELYSMMLTFDLLNT